MSEEEEEEIEIQKTDVFTERFVTEMLMTKLPDGFFMLEFGRPMINAYAKKTSGEISGYKGELKLDVRLIMSPITVKKIFKAIEGSIKKYEDEHGNIKID